jgi:DNA-binding CsgD family transcriptional regulator
MTNPLKPLFEAIDQLQDEADLRSQLAPQIGTYFVAKRSGIFFFDQLLAVEKKASKDSGKENRAFQKALKIALSVEHNPVARYLAERHTPVHEGLVASPKTWAIICPRPDHWHVMAGPIVSHGQLVGAVGCTRDRSMPAFNTQDLADLSAICLHLSVWMSTGRATQSRSPNQASPQDQQRSSNAKGLTAREWQIAELVALGQTNAEIGKTLWITENSVKQALKRMFRKLRVSSRAAMVAHLYASSAVSEVVLERVH